MPDTAIWSDQHHAGHVHAEVRNTIRCPAAITIDGHEYAGLVDLRLFRQRGHAYSDAELFQAMGYAEYVRAAYQALADYLVRSDRTVRIDAFDKDWFRRYYSALCTAATIDGSQFESTNWTRLMAPVEQASGANMTELFRILHSHATGDRVALVESPHLKPETSLSYRDLVTKCLALRTALKRFNVAPGACISLWSQRPLHQAVALIAGLANGVIINLVNPGLSAAMFEGQLLHTRPSLLIVDEDTHLPDGLFGNALSTIRGVRWRDVFGDATPYDVKAAEASLAFVSSKADESAGLLIYTSGTTGDPKGVLLRWNEIYANVHQAISTLGYKPGWIAGSLLPRFHTFTLISDLLPALMLGGRAILVDSFELARLKSIVEAFRKHGVQSYSAAPIILEACCGLNAWATTPTLRFAVAGAAPLKEKTRIAYVGQFGHPIIPCYGLSETSCFATISPPDAVRAGSTGKPAGIEMCVFGDDGEVVANGLAGELAMRGPSVIRNGYFRDNEGRFAKSFTSDGWFLSGDIGRIDSDGYVYVTGRKKNMIIRGGEKIYLEDVDRCIFEYLGVVDCVSIVRCNPGVPDHALTFVVTADSKPIPREEIDALVRRVLTPRHIPDRIHFIERVPRTPSGKASLRELLLLAQTINGCLELQ
ncbi:MAG: acyl--CoA ligase [Herminiimonas sp.]|nr:acyl--CoA ligase [Herminiimonas sp.]